MSLQEAYTLAHTARCRLQMETSRPQRNLRFVVGHLMHYESLRLRIVEIEHDLSKTERARRRPHHQLPASNLAQESHQDEQDEHDEEEFIDDDPDAAELSLERFPSGSARPPQPPPDLEPDEDDYDDEDELVSPDEPDQATLQRTLSGDPDLQLNKLYETMRACHCHGKTDTAPAFERMWQLPSSEPPATGKDGVTRAVGQVQVQVAA